MGAFFDGTRPGRIVSSSAGQFELPALYFREDSFQALFTADLQKLQAAMPSDRLHPIAAGRGRGYLGVAALDYLETSVEPYGEVAIVVPVVHGRRPPPVLPVLFELFNSTWPGLGLLVLHLPVTHRLARDAGREVWGYAKFLADMQFQNTPELHECRLDEGGQHILTLRIAKRGLARTERRPLVTYSVKDRALVRTTIQQQAVARAALGAGDSSLVLGETHPVAQSMRALDLDPRPVLTRYFLERAAILSEGEVVEHGVRPLDGYIGADRPGELRSVHFPQPTAPA